ncbi:MAG: RidA family protein [Armatimonadetes bacterium]|nr:RidA family protein [Armatimonadota bacterium]
MLNKTAIYPATGGAVAGAPYTPAVKVGSTLYISGQLGLDKATGKPFDDFDGQVTGAIAGLKALCEAAGGSLENIVKTTVFLSDLSQFAALNAIYARHFTGDIRPARSTFQVAALPLGAAVEIEAVAVFE